MALAAVDRRACRHVRTPIAQPRLDRARLAGSRAHRRRRGRRARDAARAARPRRRASLDDARRAAAHVHVQRHVGGSRVRAGAPAAVSISPKLADEVVCDSVAEVDPDAGRIRCASGDELELRPPRARRRREGPPRLAARHHVREDPAEEALHGLLEEIERGYVGQVAFVVPGGTVWPLPLYELAIMTARQAWSMGMDRVRFALVTPEERPLAMFGRAPSQAIGGAARRLRHRVHRLDLCERRPRLRAARPRRASARPSARRQPAGARRPGSAGRARGSVGLHPRRPARSRARPGRRLCGG